MTVKAIIRGKAWTLDVLGVPYGSPADLDSDREYFDRRTKLHEDKFSLPPAVYYHGIGPDGKPMGAPEYIGKTEGYEDRSDGRWYRVLLDEANEYARRIWEAAKQGMARASTGSNHLHRVDEKGHIYEWPVMELSLIDMNEQEGRLPANRHAVALPALKAVYEQAGLTLPDVLNDPDDASEPEADPAEGASQPDAETSGAASSDSNTKQEHNDMEIKEIQELVQKSIADALKADRVAREAEDKVKQEAEEKRQQELEAVRKEAAEEAVKALKADMVKAGRLPEGDGMPAVIDADILPYDNLDPVENAMLVSIVDSWHRQGMSRRGVSDGAIKALAMKTESEATKGSTPSIMGQRAVKASGFAGKANEMNYSTYASYGDDWVAILYSQNLWEKIREGTYVAGKLPTVEVPPGHESIYLPLESGDPTFYKMAQSTGLAATTSAAPLATVLTSKVGTTDTSLTLAKMGCRVIYTGEMEEDSIIPWMSNLRRQIEVAGIEQFEGAIIDGDTTLTANTNINDIAGTPDDTEYFTLVNGPRKLALVTNTANSRAGGTLNISDFLETLKLMGAGGKNAHAGGLDKVGFLLDPFVYWKALELDEVKTKDVFTAATLENGQLVSIFGREIGVGWNGWRSSFVNTGYEYKQEATGKVDIDTDSDNLYGSLLAIRWDQWLLGYRRRMKIEATRWPSADASEIVAQMRWGLVYRDTDASAVTYGLTV